MPRLKLVITRAQAEASTWSQALMSAGHEVLSLPLLAFGPPPRPMALVQAWQQASQYHAAMFVSGQAVRSFFAAQPPGQVWPGRCWATGPGTRSVLLSVGVDATQIDMPAPDVAQLDSEALWDAVSHQVMPLNGVSPGAVLLVRGSDEHMAKDDSGQGHGRDWLAQRLHGSGVVVDYLVAYQRLAPVWSQDQQNSAAQAAANGAVWLFSSSQALAHLHGLMPLQKWAHARALATHPRIATALRGAGWGGVSVCKGELAAVLHALENISLM